MTSVQNDREIKGSRMNPERVNGSGEIGVIATVPRPDPGE